MGSADPSASGPEGRILTSMPPMQFFVDERLKKNVQFWVDIYTKYSTTQGLVHDAKYVDHIYEVLSLKTPKDRSERALKNVKKHWMDVLASIHRKQRTRDKMP